MHVNTSALGVDVAVMAPAEAYRVVEVGFSSFAPFLGMVNIAGVVGIGASGKGATPIARDNGVLL